jgi:hypothetical protein
VIALDAVVAREVALQGREHRDLERVGVLAHVAEELRQRAALRLPVGDDEALLGELRQRIVFFRGPRAAFAESIEQIDDVVADDQLRVGERVHQEHVRAVERHTNGEHRRLHAYSGSGLVGPWPREPRQDSLLGDACKKVQRVFRPRFPCRRSPMRGGQCALRPQISGLSI